MFFISSLTKLVNPVALNIINRFYSPNLRHQILKPYKYGGAINILVYFKLYSWRVGNVQGWVTVTYTIVHCWFVVSHSEFRISDIKEGIINKHIDVYSGSMTSYWKMKEEELDSILRRTYLATGNGSVTKHTMQLINEWWSLDMEIHNVLYVQYWI
jgi:hypothetical protein